METTNRGAMNYLYLDIETNLAHDKIWVCCMTDSEGRELYITDEDKQDLQAIINQYDYVVAHNGIGFDFPVLQRVWGITVPEDKQVDTLVLSRLFNPDIPDGHSLAAWGRRLGVPKMDFEMEDFDAGLTDEMLEYCQHDVKVLKKTHEELITLMSKWKRGDVCTELEHEAARIVYRQVQKGFLLDRAHAGALHCELTQRMAEIEAQLQEVFPPITHQRYSDKTGKRLKDKVEVFNVGSRQQIASRLSGLGIDFSKLTEKGNVVIDETVLEGVDLPEAKLMAEYLMIQKRVGLVAGWLKYADDSGRIHGKVITNGAVSGRMTHSTPNLGQTPSADTLYGMECRQSFVVPTGYKLVGCDLSGIELRCLAHYMQDEEWTKELLDGDIHTKNQLAAGLETRAQAKTMIYAVLYGAGAAKMGSIVGGGRNRGKEITDKFYANTPALLSLKKKVDRMADKGFLPGLDGRRLIVRHAHAALNTLLQSCGAIIAKQWLVEIDKELQKQGLTEYAHQVVVVHDEVQFEVKEEYAEQVAIILSEAAQKAGEALAFRVPVDAESKIGNNWYETH